VLAPIIPCKMDRKRDLFSLYTIPPYSVASELVFIVFQLGEAYKGFKRVNSYYSQGPQISHVGKNSAR